MKRFLIFSISAMLMVPTPAAFAWDDPFHTQQLLPPKISPNNPELLREGTFICAQNLPDYPLSALDVVDLTLCNNPQTRAIWAAAQLEAAQLGQSKSQLLPSINANLNANQNHTRGEKNTKNDSANLNLSWLLLDFGTRKAQIKRDTLLLEAALNTENDSVQSLIQTALKNFYTAQAQEAAVLSTLEAEKYAQESFEAAKNRYEVGVGTPADQLQAQTAYSQATLKRISAQGSSQIARANLLDSMGFQPTTKIVLATVQNLPKNLVLEKDIQKIIQQALKIRPDLKAQNLKTQAAKYNIQAAKSAGLPTLSFSASQSFNERLSPQPHIFNRSGTLGLTLNIPLFTGFERHYLIQSAQARYESTAAQEEVLKNQVALDVWQAHQNLLTALQTLKTTQDLIQSAKQSFDVAMGRYKAGVGNILDLLSAQSSLADAKLQKIQAQLNWHAYRIDFAKAAGNLNYQSLLLP